MEPFDVEEVYNQSVSFTPDVEQKVFSDNIINLLNEHIPVSLRADYRKFVDGASIPKSRRENLIHEIKIIIKKHWGSN